MAKFMIKPLVGLEAFTVRLGAGTGAANNWADTENGKIVKLVGESRYDLATIGDNIEGVVVALEAATADGYTIGSIIDEDFIEVTAYGLQGTEGTGNVAIGDQVVAATAIPKGTKLSGPPRVVKATSQTGVYFVWRVVSLGTAGTGAPGTTVVVNRIT